MKIANFIYRSRQNRTRAVSPAGAQHSGKAQALVEFAIILPILLLLIFGLIEFGRIFQAWLAVTNATRFGLRYAVTGDYKTSYCVDLNGNGITCKNETNKDQRQLEEDAARLPSIREVARGVAVGPVINDVATLGQPGYFHVTICSSREYSPGNRYSYVSMPNPVCAPNDDAGGPGDRVLVAVTYQHPLIMPFLSNIWPSVSLRAERTGIVENFRVSRVLGLPPEIATPVPPPTDTPIPPTNTPVPPTDTPVPPTATFTSTPTMTFTPSATPTATPAARCDMLDTNSTEPIYHTGTDIIAELANNGPYPIKFTKSTLTWNGQWHDENEPEPGVQFLRYLHSGTVILNPANLTLSTNPTFSHNINWTLAAGNSDDFELEFSSILDYFHADDFNLHLDYTVGTLVCDVDLTGLPGPVVSSTVPSGNITTSFSIQAQAYDPPDAATDTSGIASLIFFVYTGTDTNTTPISVVTDNSSPYCLFGTSGGVCRKYTTANKWPNSNVFIQNGTYTILMLATDRDAHQQYTQIKRTITIAMAATATPTVTRTPTITPTRTRTPTRTNTPVRTNTTAPTNTPIPPTPTDTNTPKPTTRPTNTPTRTPVTPTATRTNTVVPTNTVIPTQTVRPSNTPVPPTLTPSRTPTPRPTICTDC